MSLTRACHRFCQSWHTSCRSLQYRQITAVDEHHPTCIRILHRRKKTEPSYLERPKLEETRSQGFYGDLYTKLHTKYNRIMSYRGITYRLIPGTKARARQLACLAGACRYVWNHFLGENQRLMAVHRENPVRHPMPPTSFFSLGKEFTQLRLGTPWLQELSFLVVRHTLKYQADAWAQYFKGVRGRPKFKGKRGDDSFTIPEKVKLRSNHVHIPKIGWLVVRGNNPYPQGKPISATVRQCGRKWFCSVIYEVDLPERIDNGLAVGLDRNVGQVATSTGDIIPLPDTRSLEARKKHYQRMVSRRQKGSNRRKRANQLWGENCSQIGEST